MILQRKNILYLQVTEKPHAQSIWDDDAPELKISAGSPVLEGNGSTANFIITSEFYIPSLTVNYTPTSTNYHANRFRRGNFGSG